MIKDIFDSKVLCDNCNVQMKKAKLSKKGFILRALICPKCDDKIVHPVDEQNYSRFINLRNKNFRVKMRLVGNSYAVSIPKEIVSFIRQQENMMNNMVRLCFEDIHRLSLKFDELE